MQAAFDDGRTYLPQPSETGVRHIFAISSPTKVACEDNTLHVPGKERLAFEAPSDATDSTTSNFDDAMYYSDCASPPLTGGDVGAYDAGEEGDW
jgi:hypothetical protein